MLTFDPISLAVAASVIENACFSRPTAPRVKVWLRRHANKMASAIVQESTDPALNVINHIDPHLGAIVFFIAILRCLMHLKFDHKREPFWLCIAAYIHFAAAFSEGS